MTTNISEANFTEIRNQIKEFFKTKPEFTGYNFDGTASGVLIDILAYTAFYKNVHTNLAFNEVFLDTANQRQSIVSRAKELGYLPRSMSGAKATVRLSFTVTGNPSQYILPKNTRFSSTINGLTYTFVTPVEYIFDNVSNVFTKNIEIVQGVLTNFEYTVNSNDLSQRFIVPNKSVDLDYLSVSKKNSSSDTDYFNVVRANDLDLVDISGDTELYLLTEDYDGYYKLHFGDGAIGKELVNNNVIRIDYLITDGLEANGARTFSLSSNLSGVGGISILTIDAAAGGNDKETEEAIKFNAPLYFQAQGRAVTENDYKSIMLNRYSNIEDIQVWGGEKNDPPYFGKVYIAVKPLNDILLSPTQKSAIATDILSRYNVVGIRPEVVDPEYIYVYVDTAITYNANIAARSGNTQLENGVVEAIENFFDTTTNKFGVPLYYSKLVAAIDSSSPVIKNSITNLKLERRKQIIDGISTRYTFNFNNAIAPNSLETVEIEIDSQNYYIKDVPTGSAPFVSGTLKICRMDGLSEITLNANAGTINYNTGLVILDNVRIDDIPSDTVNKVLWVRVSQGNFVDPDTTKIVTDYNVYTNGRQDIVALQDITVTIVADNA
jgi:uncharacterized phage protein gp47/JayE